MIATAESMDKFNVCPKCNTGELQDVSWPEVLFVKEEAMVKCDNINCGWQGIIIFSENADLYLLDFIRKLEKP